MGPARALRFCAVLPAGNGSMGYDTYAMRKSEYCGKLVNMFIMPVLALKSELISSVRHSVPAHRLPTASKQAGSPGSGERNSDS